ncbi:hypothetical protein [Nocardia sp. IFM 10818]
MKNSRSGTFSEQKAAASRACADGELALNPDTAAAAIRQVCGRSADVDDAQQLLDMLGLTALLDTVRPTTPNPHQPGAPR